MKSLFLIVAIALTACNAEAPKPKGSKPFAFVSPCTGKQVVGLVERIYSDHMLVRVGNDWFGIWRNGYAMQFNKEEGCKNK